MIRQLFHSGREKASFFPKVFRPRRRIPPLLPEVFPHIADHRCKREKSTRAEVSVRVSFCAAAGRPEAASAPALTGAASNPVPGGGGKARQGRAFPAGYRMRTQLNRPHLSSRAKNRRRGFSPAVRWFRSLPQQNRLFSVVLSNKWIIWLGMVN